MMLAHRATATTLAITVVAYLCARATRPDRNYWPMIRVMWSVLMAVYFGAFVNNVLGGRGGPVVRLAFSAAMLGALLYALWFMRKRNRVARFVGLTLGGELLMRSVEELEAAAALTESYARHGAMPPELAARMEAALAEWRAKEAWKADIVRDVAERKRKRGIQ